MAYPSATCRFNLHAFVCAQPQDQSRQAAQSAIETVHVSRMHALAPPLARSAMRRCSGSAPCPSCNGVGLLRLIFVVRKFHNTLAGLGCKSAPREVLRHSFGPREGKDRAHRGVIRRVAR